MAAFTFATLSRAPGRLLGRERETALLEELLDDLPVRGGRLCIEGRAGLGKTTLLQQAVQEATARGIQVLWAEGIPSEQDIAYSGLGQLLTPVRDLTRQLPGELGEILASAAGYDAGGQSWPGSVGAALVELFRQMGGAVLVAVDDVQWLDPATAQVLSATVLGSTQPGIGVLTARRPASGHVPDPSSVPLHRLAPLDAALARRLVRRAHPAVSEPVLAALVGLARGNPLALVELPAALTDAELRAAALPDDAVRFSGWLRRLQADELLALPAEARQRLLVAALDDEHSAAPAGLDGTDREELEAAEEAGLIRVDERTGAIRFRHPLVRSMVIGLSTSTARRTAHQTLADAMAPDDEGYARHVAATALGPDERVAGLLDRSAERALTRGRGEWAIQTYLLAAQLSPSLDRRARRLARAAYIGAHVQGNLGEASSLIDQARRADPMALRTVPSATAVAYLLMSRTGELGSAQRVLAPAIAAASDGEEETRQSVAEALHHLLDLCIYAADEKLWATFHAAAATVDHAAVPDLALRIQTLADPVRTAGQALPRLEEALERLDDEHDPTVVARLAMAAFYVDRVDRVRQPLLRVVTQTRGGGAVGSGLVALSLLATECVKTGHWLEAERWAQEGLELCEQRGHRLYLAPFQFCLAMVAAARGDSVATNRMCAQLLSWALPRGVMLAQVQVAHVRTVLALGTGDFEEAHRHATSVCQPGRLAPHLGWALWMALDVVEAAVLSGRPAEAAAHVEAMLTHDVGTLSSRCALVSAGSAAIASPTFERELFDRALAVTDAGRWPFELARIELRYGQALRRARFAAEARAHLERALAIFDVLPAPTWAEQARSELLAASPAAPPPDSAEPGLLTPQERQVAHLASEGLTNKAIAARLQISPRTVAAHLRSIFAKLGIRTRAGLTDAMARLDPATRLVAQSPSDLVGSTGTAAGQGRR